MTLRVLFLGEGTSDSGITVHVQRIATESGVDVVITDPLIDRLGRPPNKTVAGKLQAIKDIGGVYDLVVIHRDGDRDGREARVAEIERAVADVMPEAVHAPVIPIRMTEAWLLLDEREIRQVAGNPNGKAALGLPAVRKVETVPDPKATLKEVLCRASDLNGRRLDKFKQRFPHHRRQLLERIDPNGSIALVPSWCDFVADLTKGLEIAATRNG
ncbi:DUF4276 family protein [Actinoallomurus spadix]|uniref:DUF4276 family protein n=1 Tax=Actinoallomurus spadix TaxID=79912 RepID=A0ABN0XC59_9ACTN|nr:DUF4276 family protein [Actinoallomurus spadix]MCO5988674.1 DUF4276 family protein [Actinoallomurus spadix]